MTDFFANVNLQGIVIPNLIGNRNASALRFPPAREKRAHYWSL
ncbi:hypothetical protein QFZ20_002723 [Flavobacterium sp. W4I14]|nr:hypothetical protein [Flavobacterium sp. W4I14]